MAFRISRSPLVRKPMRVALISWLLLCAPRLGWGQSVQYVYDDLGRLVGVIDPTGQTAIYHYDAVGNLLSIERGTSSQVSIISFSPGGGDVGAPVTIYGTGFSTTASQNAVTFNGTAATVTSATATQLVVSVPSGATSGAIGVTTPLGSSTSAQAFLVGITAPTITSFTPAIGTVGTSVTISGTNFDTATASDRTKLNTTTAFVTTAASTTLTTTVPSDVSSGHFTVATPHGVAVSADDFFVPPAPFQPADVVITDRITAGVSKNITIGTAGKIGLLLFDGVAGHRVALRATNVTMGGVAVSILNPNGSTLTSTFFINSGGFIDSQTLGVTGTYTIFVRPGNGATGNMTLTLYDVPPDATVQATPGGSAVTVTTTVPGQNARVTFNGTAAQRVSIRMTNFSMGSAYLTLLAPNGSTLTSTWLFGNGFFDVQTLAATGTYTVIADPADVNTGSVTIQVYDVPADVTGGITPGGAAATVTLTVPGQNASLTFSGTAGQRVSVGISNVAIWTTWVGLLTPNGSALTFAYIYSNGFIDTQTLPTTGTYILRVDPQDINIGSLTLQLYDVPADPTASITIGGASATLTTTVPGQNAKATFSGTSGQSVTVHLTNNTIGGWIWNRLLKPDGTELASFGGWGSTINSSAQTLPTTGTYTIVIDPGDGNIGSVDVSVTSP